jgi:hypothetical protein
MPERPRHGAPALSQRLSPCKPIPAAAQTGAAGLASLSGELASPRGRRDDVANAWPARAPVLRAFLKGRVDDLRARGLVSFLPHGCKNFPSGPWWRC